MHKIALKRLFFYLLIGAFANISYSQVPIKPISNHYCYYPKDKDKVIKSGTLGFYVDSFNQNDLRQTYFIITEQDNNFDQFEQIYFTIDAPSNVYPQYNVIERMTQISAKIYNTSFLTGKQSFSIYINGIKNKKLEYAGPITFVSSNDNQNPGFQQECGDANRSASDSTVKWSFKIPQTMTINSGGPKTEVLSRELININLLPTEGMFSLMEKLNPNLSSIKDIDPGYTCILPKYPEPDPKREKRLENQFVRDVSVDPVQNAIFRERSKFLTTIIKAIEIPSKNKEVTDDVLWVYNILLQLQNSKTGLKRNQTNLINNEIENFYIFLIEDFSRNGVTDESASHIHDFRNYLYQVLRPSGYGSLKPQPTRTGGPNFENDYLWDENQSVEFADDPVEGYLKVYIYAFENEHSAPVDGYLIYWISEFQHDVLAAKKTGITKSDLDNITTSCQDMASISSGELDPTFTYYFIAVVPRTGVIAMCNKVDLKKLSRDSKNRFINKPEPFAISLYGFEKCF